MSDVSKDSTESGWGSFDGMQRAAAVAAGTLTVARPVLAVTASVRIARSQEASWANTALVATSFATDADGSLARAFDAETDFGRVADPLADKVGMTAVESALAFRRGALAKVLLAARITRDIAVSVARRSALKNGCNGHDVKANGYGKVGTVGRMAVAVVGSSPVGERHPRVVDAADAASTLLTLISGGVTIYRVARSRRARRR